MALHKNNPKCEVCGGDLCIYEEEPCKAHPDRSVFFVTHYCHIDLELRQDGGTLEEMQDTLRGKNGNIYDL